MVKTGLGENLKIEIEVMTVLYIYKICIDPDFRACSNLGLIFFAVVSFCWQIDFFKEFSKIFYANQFGFKHVWRHNEPIY